MRKRATSVLLTGALGLGARSPYPSWTTARAERSCSASDLDEVESTVDPLIALQVVIDALVLAGGCAGSSLTRAGLPLQQRRVVPTEPLVHQLHSASG